MNGGEKHKNWTNLLLSVYEMIELKQLNDTIMLIVR